MTQSNLPQRSALLAAVEKRNLDHRAHRAGWLRAAVLGVFAPSLGGKAYAIVVMSLIGLLLTGVLSARTAGSPLIKTTVRIVLGGIIGMAITAGVGQLAHVSGI